MGKPISPLKLTDFGYSRVFSKKQDMTSVVGTVYTMAPEMLAKTGYTGKCDVWSVGVVSFMCCVGYTPFAGDSDRRIARAVRKGGPKFDSQRWEQHPPEAKALVAQLLTRTASDRPAAKAVMTTDIW